MPISLSYTTPTAMEKVANRDERKFRVGDRSRDHFATPADFPLHDGSPYRGLRVRRWGLGFVHRSRTISLAPCKTLAFRFAFFASLYSAVWKSGTWWRSTRGGERNLRTAGRSQLAIRTHM